MPTTTNFGWTTPADTDYVKDGANAIRTLGNGIDTSLLDLKGGTTGQILSKASNTDLDYTWINNDQGDITAVNAGTGISVTGGTGPTPTVAIDSTVATLTGIQTLTNKTINGSNNTISNVSLTTGITGTLPIGNGGTNLTTYTTGDLPYASASNTLSKLAIGTTGQVLTVSGGVPVWATAASSAKFGQIVQTIKTDTFTTTSTSFTDITGLSVNITPTSASSKIYVSFTVNGASGTSTTNSIGLIRLMRDTTAIAIGDTAGNRARASGTVSTRDTGSNAIEFNSALNFLDSPATTSQITYKVQGVVGGGTLYINRNEDDADATIVPRTVSTITVTEILP